MLEVSRKIPKTQRADTEVEITSDPTGDAICLFQKNHDHSEYPEMVLLSAEQARRLRDLLTEILSD